VIVTCRICGRSLTLSEDSTETREAGIDPHQQLRLHILERHSSSQMVTHLHRVAWIVDMLAFTSEDPAYREGAIGLLDYLMALPPVAAKQNALTGTVNSESPDSEKEKGGAK
jgi:hypothetical protein